MNCFRRGRHVQVTLVAVRVDHVVLLLLFDARRDGEEEAGCQRRLDASVRCERGFGAMAPRLNWE
jgi:hypothetical protein